jgi:ornithine cyclodeaminase/alanine dehydrogenase-like protein (mu-crystallin family)
MRYLSEAALDRLGIGTRDVIASIEAMLKGKSQGTVWTAPKSVLTPADGRYAMSTLGLADDPPYLAVKTLLLNPHNADRGLPIINSLITVLDSDTGEPVALLDGNWVTATRTAGLSAVAAIYLARPDSAVVGFVGAGVQARSHLQAFAEMFPLKSVRINGRGRPNIDLLAKLASELGLGAAVCETPDAAMEGADIVVSSVTRAPGRAPFLDANLMAPGTFAAITDLAEPWKMETLQAFDQIIVDDAEQERAMETKIAPPELIRGDLGALVSRAVTGRGDARERTAFIFRGIALGDLAVAALACQIALKASAGLSFEA